MKQRVIFLIGPTAVGKSAVAVRLAKKINAEIVSCDSMQVYKGMEIVSSQPSAAFRKTVPHHLVGVVAPSREYNVSAYRRNALRIIKKIMEKGKVPLFAGGTGLYVSILIDGIFKAKAEDAALRQRFYRQAQARGSQVLYNRLLKVDAAAAAKIHPNDTRRIVRALEVFEITGKPISVLQKQRKGITDKYDVRLFCLDMPRAELYKRIDKRVDNMFSHGLTDELKRLLQGRHLSKTAAAAIGIREFKGCLDGLYGIDEARELMKKNTRNYAKRQLTWFRKDKRIRWLQVGAGETAASVAKRISLELK